MLGITFPVWVLYSAFSGFLALVPNADALVVLLKVSQESDGREVMRAGRYLALYHPGDRFELLYRNL